MNKNHILDDRLTRIGIVVIGVGVLQVPMHYLAFDPGPIWLRLYWAGGIVGFGVVFVLVGLVKSMVAEVHRA